MPLSLTEALEQVARWEQDHVPRVPRPQGIRSLEGRIAEAITDFAGSMPFVYLHTAWFGLWVVFNAGLLLAVGLGLTPFDPFPFGLLTLIVSLEAIFLSTFVMIAQNRLSAQADARAQADYQVNVRAEAEVAKLLALVQALVEHQARASGEAEPARPAPVGRQDLGGDHAARSRTVDRGPTRG